MKNFLFVTLTAFFAVTAHAQFSGDGYYRVQNYSSSRYLAVIDPSGGRRGTDIDIAAVVGYGSAYVDANGTQVKYANDAERFSRVVWDPATVLYVKTVGGNASQLDFYGQGIDTYALTSAHLTVANSSTPGTYWAYGSAYGATLYLADNTSGRKGLADGTPITTHENGSSDLSKWNCKPINQNDGFYFGMKPTLTVGSDHYLTFFASFAFSFSGANMHAYYVSNVDKALGVAVYKEITDKVPENTPIFVKCSSAEPVNNKLSLIPPSTVSALKSTNMLKGTYFDCAKSYYHMHFVEYNPDVMRILGVTKSGKLGFVKKAKEEMSYHAAKYYDGNGNETGDRPLYTIPANSAYLYVSGAPDDLVLMTEAEYEAYKKTASSVTVKADDKSRKYGEANPTLTYSVVEGSKQGGEPTLSTTANETSPVGTYPITIAKGGLTNGTVNFQNGTLTVTQADLKITPRSYTIKQNEPLPTFEADYSGFKNNETSAVLTSQPTFTTNAPADKTPGTYKITASGAAASNYAITYGEGTLTITEASAITITANAASMVYGDDVPQLTYEVSGGTLPGTPKLVCSATKSSDVGLYDITVDVSDINYPNLKTVNAKLTINQAPLTVTAKSYTIVETDALPTFEATYSGWKNGQDESVLTTKPTLTCDVPADKAPGTYAIAVAGAAAKNYTLSFVNGTLTITQAPTITVKAAAKSMVYGDAVPELTYTVEGGTLPGKPTLTTTANSQSAVGEYDIVVDLSGISYPRLAAVNAKLTVTKAMLTVNAGTYTMKQTDPRPTFKATYSGFKNDETEAVLTKQPEFATTAPADNTPGTYDVTVSGAEAVNYDFTYVHGKLVITDADAISITVEDVSMVYGDALPELKYTVSGGTIEGTPVISCDATSQSPVGEYVITVEAGTITYPNLVLTNGTLTITPAPLTATVGDYERFLGEDNPEFVVTYEGFRNGDTEEVLTTKPVIACEAKADSPVGEYAITLSGGEAKNYTFTYVNGKLTVKEVEGISAVTFTRPVDVYSLAGRKLRSQVTVVNDLPRGVYIINGRKVVLK